MKQQSEQTKRLIAVEETLRQDETFPMERLTAEQAIALSRQADASERIADALERFNGAALFPGTTQSD